MGVSWRGDALVTQVPENTTKANPRKCRSLLAGDVPSLALMKEGIMAQIACKQAPTTG
jgi:hypothetical protein